MPMTLMNYVTSKVGTWATSKQASGGDVIELSHADDGVTMQGPLSLNVSFVAESVFSPVSGNGGQARTSTNDLYSYNLEIPAGYTWRYLMSDGSPDSRLVPGFRAIIRQAPCSRATPTQAPDLPCDFAVGNQPCIGEFFPVGCEPCGNGPVRMPPAACGPSLAVTPASGGCIRPRFFNGMFITREDLETQLRYFRIKNKLERKTIGQGVVWGLGVSRDGRSILVKPGYAVDCCGNDLTVTSNYKVDPQTLLSDPAICNLLSRGQQCFSLLLEYVECPEQPRPVHGDPCVGSATACEMSRVRETVRLRLVPPRDYRPNGPISKFLNTIAATTARASTSSSIPPSGTSGPQSMPFSIGFTVVGGAVTGSTLTLPTLTLSLEPASAADPLQQTGTQSVPLITYFLFPFEVSLTTIPGFSFTTVTVEESNASLSVQTVNGSAQWDPPLKLPPFTSFTAPPTTLATDTVSWIGTQSDGTRATGTTTIIYNFNFTQPLNSTTPGNDPAVKPEFTVAGGVLTLIAVTTFSVAPVSFPCLTDPCCPDGTKPLFAVTPPWADANPFNPSEAADFKVLEMAFAYALAVGYFAQGDLTDARVALRSYAVVAKSLVDGSITVGELITFLTATEQLLSDWCCSFLYPGPSCQGDPHGVVIGCVTVNSDGNLGRIDPWSGRRWVVTYPLLSYWGEQIGMVPPDVLASKLFSVVCCLAGLGGSLITAITPDMATLAEATVQEVPLGAGTLRVGPLQPASNAQTNLSQPQTRTTSVDLTTFTAKILAALARSPAPAGTPMVDITLAGYPDVHLIVPDDAATPIPCADIRRDHELGAWSAGCPRGALRDSAVTSRLRRITHGRVDECHSFVGGESRRANCLAAHESRYQDRR